MTRRARLALALLVSLTSLAVPGAYAQQAPPGGAGGAPAQPPGPSGPELEPKAIEVLKASSARLAAARTMAFTAVTSYESPSRPGPALVYTTTSSVIVQRPDKMRVLTPADGPAQEFYYNGKSITAFMPAENLVATAPAPPTLDAALEEAYRGAGIYFPFTDVVVADPYADLAKSLDLAFYIGRSKVVGGVTTDMVAYASDGVFVQVWIGADDKLPRRARAVFAKDPLRLRHQVDFSNWQLGVAVPAGTFTSAKAAKAKPIPFAHPDPGPPPGAEAPAPPKTQ